jgi:hypothetical protein
MSDLQVRPQILQRELNLMQLGSGIKSAMKVDQPALHVEALATNASLRRRRKPIWRR